MHIVRDEEAPKHPHKSLAHPRAQELMSTDWYYSPIEGMAPFGSDDGAEAFLAFYEWRQANRNQSAVSFVYQQLMYWGYPSFPLSSLNEEELLTYIKDSPVGDRMLYGTDAAIFAIAFGDLYVSGSIDEDMKQLALVTVERQMLPLLLNQWREAKEERTIHLTDFRRILTDV
ncbi:MAG: hypothetical protein EOO88_23080 [Pedobacter sp.]|nr:MAG: hypothetical protein EOO88_23080 [Pedobacter sp.]